MRKRATLEEITCALGVAHAGRATRALVTCMAVALHRICTLSILCLISKLASVRRLDCPYLNQLGGPRTLHLSTIHSDSEEDEATLAHQLKY